MNKFDRFSFEATTALITWPPDTILAHDDRSCRRLSRKFFRTTLYLHNFDPLLRETEKIAMKLNATDRLLCLLAG